MAKKAAILIRHPLPGNTGYSYCVSTHNCICCSAMPRKTAARCGILGEPMAIGEETTTLARPTGVFARLRPEAFAGRLGVHYAWVVVGVTFFIVVAAAGVRAAPGVLIKPLEQEFGWSRSEISLAISVTLRCYGLASPV